MDIGFVGIGKLRHFGMLVRHGAKDMVQDTHVRIAQIFGGLDVISQSPKVVAKLNDRNGNANLHNDENLPLRVAGLGRVGASVRPAWGE